MGATGRSSMISSVSVEARKLVLRTCQVVQEKGILTLQQWQEYKNSRL